MNRLQAQEYFFSAMYERFNILERLGALDWVKQNIIIPPEISPTHPGPFNENLFPLANIVYDWFDDPNSRELIVVKGSQNGVSQAFHNLTCMIAYYELGDIIWVLESAIKGREMNNERIKPMLRKACKMLNLPESEDALQNSVLWLRNMKINIAGARSAGQVASRTARFAFGDEADEWPIMLAGGESNGWTLLGERVKLVEDSKIALFSKPRNSIAPELEDHKQRNRKKHDDGIIWQQYLGGTREKCLIPCPDCGHLFEIIWDRVKYHHCRSADNKSWDFIKMMEETYIQCPNCPRKIYDEEKVNQIIKHRQWRATNDGRDEDPPLPGRRSVHMSDLYCNSIEFPKLSIGALAVKCASAKTESERKAFRRGNLALPVEKKAVQKLEIAKLEILAGEYERGTLPVEPIVAFMEVDVQEHGKLFKWSKWAFLLDDTCYLIDHGETEIEDELEVILNKPIPVIDKNGERNVMDVRTDIGWIDEGDGHTTAQILNLCIKPGLYRRLSPCKGRGGSQTDNMTDRVALQTNRTHKGKPIDRYLIDGGYFMDELYLERIDKWNDYLKGNLKNCEPPPRLWFYANPDKDFCKEFTGEKKDWHMRGSRMVFDWLPKPEGAKNDYSDTAKLALAHWYWFKRKYEKVLAAHEKAKAKLKEVPLSSMALN